MVLLTLLCTFLLTNSVCGLQEIGWTFTLHLDENLTWFEAVNACSDVGETLAVITELSVIPDLEFYSNVSDFWMGLQRINERDWVWIDGTAFSWTNWDEKWSESDENCTSVTNQMRYWWRQNDCMEKRPFLCQKHEGDCGYRLYANSSIVAHNDLYEYDKTPETCKSTCDEVETFTCRSFEYNDEFGYCQYSSGNRWIHPAYYTGTGHDKEWDYYHKTCYTGVTTPVFDSIKSSALPMTSTFEATSGNASMYISTPLIVCTEVWPNSSTPVTIPHTTTIKTTTKKPANVTMPPTIVEQLESLTVEIKKINKQKTKVSVIDVRPSAQYVGIFAITFTIAVFGAIVLTDIVTFGKEIERLKRNVSSKYNEAYKLKYSNLKKTEKAKGVQKKNSFKCIECGQMNMFNERDVMNNIETFSNDKSSIIAMSSNVFKSRYDLDVTSEKSTKKNTYFYNGTLTYLEDAWSDAGHRDNASVQSVEIHICDDNATNEPNGELGENPYGTTWGNAESDSMTQGQLYPLFKITLPPDTSACENVNASK